MTFFNLLRADHEVLKNLFNEIETNYGQFEKLESLFKTLAVEINAHNEAEEATIYDVMEARPDTRVIGLKAHMEHHTAEDIFKSLVDKPFDSDEWQAQFMIFKKLMLDHIQDEETNVFEVATQAFTADELEDMAIQFSKKKEQYSQNKKIA